METKVLVIPYKSKNIYETENETVIFLLSKKFVLPEDPRSPCHAISCEVNKEEEEEITVRNGTIFPKVCPVVLYLTYSIRDSGHRLVASFRTDVPEK